MATNTYGLTTVTRMRNRLAITVTDSTLDSVITRMIYAATDYIERYCGNTRFLRLTYTNEIYNGSDPDDGTPLPYLVLKNQPLSSVTALQYRVGERSSPSWVDFGANDYEPDYELGIIRMFGKLPYGTQNIRVSYVAGYLIDFTNENDGALHTLPHEISDLCERLVTKLFKRRQSEGRSQEGFESSAITWGSFLEEHDKNILANYNRVPIV